MYAQRAIEDLILKANDLFPVVLMTGPRQVGKTTTLKKCSDKKRKFISLDDVYVRNLAKNDPELFLQTYKFPLFIDEIQYAPELLPYIKKQVDAEKGKGMFWLTGSQHFHLMRDVSESLAGRVAVLNLQGFSQREKFNLKTQKSFIPTDEYIEFATQNAIKIDVEDVYQMIWKGSYPEVNVVKKMDWELFYSSYLSTYIERDVQGLSSVSNKMTFLKFMRVLAARTSQVLNLSDIARDIGVSSPTIKSWLSILEASALIFLLEPYYMNITKRMIKTPKIYFLDTGLAAYLTSWQTPQTLETGAMAGAFLETYVVSEIVKSYWNNGKKPPLYFFRDKERREIDILIEQNGTIHPVEIKKKSNPDTKDIKHFSILENSNLKTGKGCVICFASENILITKDVSTIPLGYL